MEVEVVAKATFPISAFSMQLGWKMMENYSIFGCGRIGGTVMMFPLEFLRSSTSVAKAWPKGSVFSNNRD